MSQFQSLRGMVDLLPEDSSRWEAVETLARDIFQGAGLKEIRTPLLENSDLFCRSIGEATDVVGKEMYSFLDRGGRSCTLRPEGTASVVRAAIQNGLLSLGPQRLWYKGAMFRYERPQAGRQRQFHQIGIEHLGFANPRDDAEIISIAWALLNDLGLKGLSLELNTLGSNQDRLNYKEKLIAWLEKNKAELDTDSQQRINKNPLRVLDSKNPTTQNLLTNAPLLKESLSESSEERFLKVQEFLSALNIPFMINDRLVRGLDYYAHTAFEITSTELGAQSTICGGGRYDGLIEMLGGPATPAMGWAIGLERLMLVIKTAVDSDPSGDAARLTSSRQPDLYVVNKGEKAELNALIISQNLRAKGLIVELDCTGSAFSKQFKRADRSGAKWALIVGDHEVETGQVKLRSLSRGDSQNSKQRDESLIALHNFQDIFNKVSSES